MKNLVLRVGHLFHWHRNPAGVFLIALPLLAVGLTLHGLRAYLVWRDEGDPALLWIFGFFMVLMLVAAYMMLRTYFRIQRNLKGGKK